MVLDEDLNEIEPGTGVMGKVARKGNIPLGYYKDEKKTAETFVTGPDGIRYSMPGDFAILEDGGTITLLGRGSVSINSGGEKIFPEEVESAVKCHPAVFDCHGGRGARRALGPAGGRGHPAARGRGVARAERRAGALPHQDRRLQGAPRSCTWWSDPALPQRQARLPVGRRAGRRRARPVDEAFA